MSSPLWPDEHVTALRQHIEVCHFSASEATAALNASFGSDYSRNAVISKCKRADPPIHMAGKAFGGRTGPKGGPSTSKRNSRTKATTPPQRPDVILRQRFPAVQPMPQCDSLPPGTVALIDLDEDGCKWPSGDPARFCNLKQCAGSVYCEAHWRISVRVPERR